MVERLSCLDIEAQSECNVVTENRVSNPVVSTVLTSPRVKHILLNDKLLGKLGIVLINFGEGIWCFRDELGVKPEEKLLTANRACNIDLHGAPIPYQIYINAGDLK